MNQTQIDPAQWAKFGRHLRDLRNAAGYSRLQLAQRAKLSDATIKFTETARHAPSRATLIRLMAVEELRLSWDDVPGHPDPPDPPGKRVPAVCELEEWRGLDEARVRAYLDARYPRWSRDPAEYGLGCVSGGLLSPHLLDHLAALEKRSVQAVLRDMNPRWRRGDRDGPTLDAAGGGGLWLLRWEGKPPCIVAAAEVVRLVRCSSDPFWVWPCDQDGNRIPWPEAGG